MVRIGAETADGRIQIISGLNGDEQVRVPRNQRPATMNDGSKSGRASMGQGFANQQNYRR